MIASVLLTAALSAAATLEADTRTNTIALADKRMCMVSA
jgi:hypothetical protein